MDRRATRLATLACVLALVACAQISAPTADRPAPQVLTGHLAQAAARSGAPGMVAAIYRDGHLAEVFTWGGADCAGHGPVNAFADFEIGSISKQITAAGLLLLWEQGRVDLEAPVGTYLADIPEAWKRVTLRQLLTHTSGVPDYEEAGGYGVYETAPTPQQVFDIVRDRPLDFDPGAQWSYSNTGYFLLSLVIERVSGMKFGDYMRSRVFAPLHMSHTFVSGYAPADAAIAQGCKPGANASAPRASVRPISEASTFGAGGILSSVEDWGAWDTALHRGGFLSQRSSEALFASLTLPDGSDTKYGFGMEIDDFRGEPRHGHTGQTQGFTAEYRSFPRRGVAVLVLTNTYGGEPGALTQALEVKAMPDLSFDRLAVAPDPDPQISANVTRALRQAILSERPFDLLDAGTLRVATEDAFAANRARLHDVVADLERLDHLRATPLANGDVRRLYRATDRGGDTSYFGVVWREGKLHGLRWDDE